MVAMKEPSGAAYAVGRLTGCEPLGFEAGDNNWYRFVANGPAGKTDPSGLGDCPPKKADCKTLYKDCVKSNNDRWADCRRRAVAVCTLLCKLRFPWLGPWGPSRDFVICMSACETGCRVACNVDHAAGETCCAEKRQECVKSGNWPTGVRWWLKGCPK
jgi:hypothetical protein